MRLLLLHEQQPIVAIVDGSLKVKVVKSLSMFSEASIPITIGRSLSPGLSIRARSLYQRIAKPSVSSVQDGSLLEALNLTLR